MLGDHLDVGEHRHEVRVAGPARHHVQVPMVGDADAGDAPDVPAEIEAVGCVDGAQRVEPLRAEPVDLERLVVVELTEVRPMAVGRDEEVPGGVRELVEHDERTLAAVNDELLLVAAALGGPAEDAAVLLVGVLHVLEAPRRPETL